MKTKKGFTLIELMVAMGIIAVLVTMSVVAIQIVQRSLRDTQRRDVANTVNLWLAGFYNDNGTYPLSADITFRADQVAYKHGSSGAKKIVDLSGPTVAKATSTDAAGTAYCYDSTASGSAYLLVVKVEGGSTVEIGNADSTVTCEDSEFTLDA